MPIRQKQDVGTLPEQERRTLRHDLRPLYNWLVRLFDEKARKAAHDMSERTRNFVYAAIYRAKSRCAWASASRCDCFTPAKAYVAGCWACDAFGRIDPGLNITSIINIVQKGQ